MTRRSVGLGLELADMVDWIGQHLNPPHWHRAAACRNVGADMFFVGRGRSPKAAEAFCAVCPVFADCRAWALSQRHLQGIWAGMTGPELAAERKRRRA